MGTRKQSEQVLWCPICDVSSDECVQPEGEEAEDGDGEWMFVYWVEGHAAQWVTDAERKQEEANDIAVDLPS